MVHSPVRLFHVGPASSQGWVIADKALKAASNTPARTLQGAQPKLPSVHTLRTRCLEAGEAGSVEVRVWRDGRGTHFTLVHSGEHSVHSVILPSTVLAQLLAAVQAVVAHPTQSHPHVFTAGAATISV